MGVYVSVFRELLDHPQHILSVAINAVSLALLDAGVPMTSVVTSATCGLLPDGALFLDPSQTEEELSASLVTTACSSTTDGVLTSLTNGTLSYMCVYV